METAVQYRNDRYDLQASSGKRCFRSPLNIRQYVTERSRHNDVKRLSGGTLIPPYNSRSGLLQVVAFFLCSGWPSAFVAPNGCHLIKSLIGRWNENKVAI